MDRAANVVLDIEGLPQPSDKCCSGSPKMMVRPLFQKVLKGWELFEFLEPSFFTCMQRALSRKGSNRLERRGSEEQVQEDFGKRLIIKGNKMVLFLVYYFIYFFDIFN
jgi:hypothetical protein